LAAISIRNASLEVLPFRRMESRRRSELISQGSSQAAPFASSDSFFGKTYRLATIHRAYVTGDRQTDTTSYHQRDRYSTVGWKVDISQVSKSA